MGRHMLRLLKFSIRYPGWHSMSKYDPVARRAMRRLEARGLLEVIGDQFRLHVPEDWYKLSL